MANFYNEQSKNVRRTWVLMIIFLLIIIGLGYLASYWYGNPHILYGAIIFSLLMNVASYWYSDRIVISLTGARLANRSEYPDLYNIVENLSITAGLPMPKVYIVDEAAPNAFATGRDKNHAAVAVTTGLLKLLDRAELEGVVAHELAHIGNRDILLSTVVVVLVGFVTILADIFLRGGIGRSNDNNRGANLIVIIGLVFVILSPIIAKLIQLAISRKREFLADASAVELTRFPDGLARALQKIESAHIPMQKTNNAIAHLYISNPVSGFGRKISNLFRTHPPTAERVKALIGH